MCECTHEICVLQRRIKAIKARGSVEELANLVDELHEMHFMTRCDLNYENAIADGSWPQAVEIMERRLENAKKVEAKRLMDNPNV